MPAFSTNSAVRSLPPPGVSSCPGQAGHWSAKLPELVAKHCDAGLPSLHPFHAQLSFSSCQSPSLCPQVEFPQVMAPAGLAAPMTNRPCSRWLCNRHQINLLLSFCLPQLPGPQTVERTWGRKSYLFPISILSCSPSPETKVHLAPCGIVKDACDSQWQLWSGP